MRLGSSALGVVAVATLALGACSRSDAPSLPSNSALGRVARAVPAHRTGLAGQFQHVIVIVQENRTVDNLFNGFPGADTVTSGVRRGKTVQLEQIPLEPAVDPDHTHDGFVLDYDNGKLDDFDHEFGKNRTAYAYVQQSDVQNYWTLASRFTLADETFQMNMGPSFAAHVNLVAAQGGYPMAFAGNPTTGSKGPPGCLGSDTVAYLDMTLPYPQKTTATGPACMDMETIFDLLDQNGIGWRYYAPDYGAGLTLWSAPDYITHIADGPDHANLVSPETNVLSDIANGALQPVSYVIPEYCSSDHPHGKYSDELAGPHWVAAVTNAIGASSHYWSNTLILVTWDDWGGWYDHKAPSILNDDQLSFRVPLLVISAYPSAPGVPDHTTRNQASVITAIESNFGLGSLGQLDAQTDDLSNTFNFSQPAVQYGAPLPAATPAPDCKAERESADAG